MNAYYVTSYNARTMTSASSGLQVFFDTPDYRAASKQLFVSNIQVIGGTGTVYFVLVFYKEIKIDNSTGHTTVNIRMNKVPSVEQVLNCENWLGQTAEGCARAVYTGVGSLTAIFAGIEADSMYLIYYVVANEFPMRPVVVSGVQSGTVVTYSWEKWISMAFFLILSLIL